MAGLEEMEFAAFWRSENPGSTVPRASALILQIPIKEGKNLIRA